MVARVGTVLAASVGTTGTNATTLSTTMNVDATANFVVITVHFGRYSGVQSNLTSLTLDGVGLSLVTSSDYNGTDGSRVATYTLVNPNTGTGLSVVANFAANVFGCTFQGAAYSGVDTTTPYVGFNYATTANTVTSGFSLAPTTTTVANDYLYSAAKTQTTFSTVPNNTIGSSATDIGGTNSDGGALASCDLAITGAGAGSTYIDSGGYQPMWIVTFAIKAAGGVTQALTAQLSAASQGALAISTTIPLVSQIASLSQGTLTYSAGSNVNVTLSSNSLGLIQSNLSYILDKQLNSQLLNANTGNVSYSAGSNVNVTLSGQTLGVTQGIINASLSKGINSQLLLATQSNLTYVANSNLTVLLTGQSIGLSQGNILISGTDTQLTDTHDGFWAKQWIKANKREEKKRIEAIEIDIEQIDEQIVEVKKHKPVELVSTVKQDTFMQDFLAEQERLLLKLIAQKQQLIDEEDEILLLLL